MSVNLVYALFRPHDSKLVPHWTTSSTHGVPLWSRRPKVYLNNGVLEMPVGVAYLPPAHFHYKLNSHLRVAS